MGRGGMGMRGDSKREGVSESDGGGMSNVLWMEGTGREEGGGREKFGRDGAGRERGGEGVKEAARPPTESDVGGRKFGGSALGSSLSLSFPRSLFTSFPPIPVLSSRFLLGIHILTPSLANRKTRRVLGEHFNLRKRSLA